MNVVTLKRHIVFMFGPHSRYTPLKGSRKKWKSEILTLIQLYNVGEFSIHDSSTEGGACRIAR